MFRELRLTFVFIIMSYIAWRAPRAGINLTWIWLGSLPVGFAAGHWIAQNPAPRMRYLRLYGAALWCAALVCALVRESYQIPAEQILPALLAAVGIYLPAYALGVHALEKNGQPEEPTKPGKKSRKKK